MSNTWSDLGAVDFNLNIKFSVFIIIIYHNKTEDTIDFWTDLFFPLEPFLLQLILHW